MCTTPALGSSLIGQYPRFSKPGLDIGVYEGFTSDSPRNGDPPTNKKKPLQIPDYYLSHLLPTLTTSFPQNKEASYCRLMLINNVHAANNLIARCNCKSWKPGRLMIAINIVCRLSNNCSPVNVVSAFELMKWWDIPWRDRVVSCLKRPI